MVFKNINNKQFVFGICTSVSLFVLCCYIILPGSDVLKFRMPDMHEDAEENIPNEPIPVVLPNDENAKTGGTKRKEETLPDVTKLKSPYIDRKFYINESIDTSTKHKILWWNEPGWMIPGWDKLVHMEQCLYKNCEMVFDQKQFSKSSAVLFSLPDEGMGKRPPVTLQQRNPDQAWVFFTLESPIHIASKDRWSPHWKNVFNWSWTYRQDADIFHPYGEFITREFVPEKNYTEIFREKKKLAAWLVSHCKTYSGREQYASILNKHAQIDIFGDCGKKAPEDIENVISADYKFYIGFENSLCKDYITEKFFKYYKLDAVTIVRGKMDYNAFLPNGSFINTADFSSIKSLAKFMHKLGSNEEEYIKYLKIKDRYEVYEREFMYRNALCDICEKLNNLDKHRKTYTDVNNWLGPCFNAQDLKEL